MKMLKELNVDLYEGINNPRYYDDKTKEEYFESNEFFSSGYDSLDRLTGGFVPGELTVIGGAPGMGKSSLALNIALIVMKNTKSHVYIFSTDSSELLIYKKLISIKTEIPLDNIIKGKLNVQQRETIDDVVDLMSNKFTDYNLKIAGPAVHINDIEDELQANVEFVFLSFILVDGLDGVSMYPQNRNICVDDELDLNEHNRFIVRQLKALAQKYNVPIIATADTYAGAISDGHNPTLSDLEYFSGHISKYIDTILLLYREDYYNYDIEGGSQDFHVFMAKSLHKGQGIINLHINTTKGFSQVIKEYDGNGQLKHDNLDKEIECWKASYEKRKEVGSIMEKMNDEDILFF